MYKLFLTIRYLRKRRIAYFAVAAVTLCTAMVLIVMSVMGGWLDLIKVRARGLLGDIIVDNRAYPGMPLYEEFLRQVNSWPEIVKATPVIYTGGLLRFPNTEQSGLARIVGVRLEEVKLTNAFGESLFYDRFYPGTTHLGEQQQPMMGFDLSAEPRPAANDPSKRILPPLLPEPYQSALDAARRAHLEKAGEPLTDDTSLDSTTNQFLRENHLPEIPGWYRLNEESPEPAMTGNPLPGLILGRDIVAQRLSDGRYDRDYPRGSMVTLTFWASSARGNVDPIPVRQPFRYVDDSRTGIYEIDSQHVYADFDLVQKLLQMGPAERADGGGISPARCSQIQIKIAPGVDARALCKRLEAAYHELGGKPEFNLDPVERRLVDRVEAMTWEQSQAHIIAPVEKERQLVTTLFAIISLVAVALVLCIFYMIVVQKTRDIGIIKSIGASSSGVAFIFVFYGMAVGVVGSVLGVTLGYYFVTYINEVQAFLTFINPAWQVWDRAVYSFDQIPNEVQRGDMVVVIVFAILSSTIGSVSAAWRAGNMQPVEAIRYE